MKDVTLREIKALCKRHRKNCTYCPMYEMGTDIYTRTCILAPDPQAWRVKKIEKAFRIKDYIALKEAGIRIRRGK